MDRSAELHKPTAAKHSPVFWKGFTLLPKHSALYREGAGWGWLESLWFWQLTAFLARYRLICTRREQSVVWQGGLKKPSNAIHLLNNSVGLNKGRTPKLTCETVGHIQDFFLPGAQQHTNDSLLISNFSYSKWKRLSALADSGQKEAAELSRLWGASSAAARVTAIASHNGGLAGLGGAGVLLVALKLLDNRRN